MFRIISFFGDVVLLCHSFQTMQAFLDYISFEAVTEVLVSKRVQLADKRHKKHMLHLMSPKMSLGMLTDAERQLLSLLPSRKHWVTLGEKGRYRKTEDGAHLQRRSASQCNKMAIRWTIEKDMSCAVKPAYLLRLESFVTKLQSRVKDVEFKFDAPMVFPEKKDESSCRPLCKFTNLEDSVIIILANKYLTELLNDQFYDESLAFRSKRTYHGQKDYVTSHHDAIARIKEYRMLMADRNLYVSECDLKKFYDTVSHSVVRTCYQKLLRKVAKENPALRFDEINRVFEAYLRCYTFPKNVYCKNHFQDFWEEHCIDEKQRCFKWVDEKLLMKSGVARSYRGLMRMGIGVPQGGALSGLIANMVLNSVDHDVEKEMKPNDLYLRYCDDMIIISTNRQRCHMLFLKYYKGAKKLKLVPHEPEPDLQFGQKEFWKGKSKDAYLWEMGRDNAAEWIGFVGYEMSRNGMIRIRRKSFRKELDKQKSVVFEKVLNKILGKDRVSDSSLYGSLERKLVSMSVGKVAVWNAKFRESKMCWTDGFRELEMNPVLSRQLHELDRHRGMMLSAAAKRIKNFKDKGKKLKRKDMEQLDDEKNPDSRGMVHSYYYQFAKE